MARGDEGPATGEERGADEVWLRAGETIPFMPFDSREDFEEWSDTRLASSDSDLFGLGGGFCRSFRRNKAAVAFGLSVSSVGLCKGEGGHDAFAEILRGAVD